MFIQFTPFILLLLISGIIAAALLVIGWYNRALPVAKPFILLMAAETIWIFGSAFEMMSTQLGTVLLINNLEYPAMMTVPVALLMISLIFTGREHYLTKKTIPLLFVVPVIVCLLVFTNPWHNLYYSGFHASIAGGVVVWVYEHGPLFWLMFAYNYLVGLLAFLLAAGRLFSASYFYRRQALILVLAGCIPVVFNLAYVLHLEPFPDYDVTQVAFLLTGIILAIGLLRYQFFSAVPVAYSRVFATISDGVFVIDSWFRVIDLNPAAERIALTSPTPAVGMDIRALLPAITPVIERRPPEPSGPWQEEVMLMQDGQSCYFDVLLIPLDTQGTGSKGFLCMFRDVTGRKNAELSLTTANKKINLLTRITRHDVENKLMVVHGYLSLLKKTPLTPVQRDYLDREETALGAMRDHIAFTRKYQQLGAHAPVWQNAEALIRQAKTQVFFNMVSFTCEVGPVQILADPMLERVFYNLLDNAIMHGGKNLTEVKVTSRTDAPSFILVFEDTGVGISPEDQEHLFEQGFGKNNGMGLFLSREILAITDITIEQNGTPESGARFEIRVPPGKFRFPERAPGENA